MPWSGSFKLFDLVSCLSLVAGIYYNRRAIANKCSQLFVRWLYVVPALLVVDVFSSITCKVGDLSVGLCSPIHNFAFYVHASESFLLGLLLIVLMFWSARMQSKRSWFAIAQIANVIAALSLNNAAPRILLGVQVLYVMVQVYWLWVVVFKDVWGRNYAHRLTKNVRIVMTAFVASNGLLTVMSTVQFNHLEGLAYFNQEIQELFPSNTAWLSQHALISGAILLLLSRNLLRGSKRAHFIALIVGVVQIVRYSSITPLPGPLVAYCIMAIGLILSSDYFRRASSIERFVARLRLALITVAVAVLIITVAGLGFRSDSPSAWQHSAFNATRVVKRALLIEVRTDSTDPLKARLFSQSLTAFGVLFYGWLASSLFLPVLIRQAEPYEQQRARKRLIQQLPELSTNSEDYFKVWPHDKYYWTSRDDAIVAYRTEGNYNIALANPIGTNLQQAIIGFDEYCHDSGHQAVWLMVPEADIKAYQRGGLESMAIGASAVIDITQFAETTVKSKWWRWARNKAKKSGVEYATWQPPLSDHQLDQLKAISDDWLDANNHTERGFALGYFDANELRQQTIHVLTDEGSAVTFANQLPTYGTQPQATVDLMRFKTGYNQSMALLLSEVILHLHDDARFTKFDLGFVPLAHSESKSTELVRTILKPVFSAKGLRQFKNKFEPEWQTNYLAYDGTLLDLPLIATKLQKALNPTIA
ncbi:DUF2156 domain-containing protein [Aeromicrobium sp.]|nr:DUF2156 domain-containing protein [Candidatus Saccharibacteria bacterium]